MEAKKQFKAKNSENTRSASFTFRTEKRNRALAEVAARAKGISLANYVEKALKDSFDNVMVDQVDSGMPGYGDRPSTTELSEGRPLSSVADELYDNDDYVCLFKRVRNHAWALSHEQIRLFNLIRVSPVLHPTQHGYNETLIRQHWNALSAVADGEANIETLPVELFGGVDVDFALMSEAEHGALYRSDPEEFLRRSKAYTKAMKGKVKS